MFPTCRTWHGRGRGAVLGEQPPARWSRGFLAALLHSLTGIFWLSLSQEKSTLPGLGWELDAGRFGEQMEHPQGCPRSPVSPVSPPRLGAARLLHSI